MEKRADTTTSVILTGRALLWRRWLGFALALLLLLVLVVLAGPRNAFGPDTPTPRAPPPADIARLDAWLAASEAAYADLVPGTAKGVVWFSAVGQRTPWAVVYVHGFSATRLETAPLAEKVASQLGANLFYTRLAGHGRGAMPMGEVRVQDWLADVQEAVRVGRMLGQRVLFIGCSTGATLGAWQAVHAQGKADAYAFISPNFGPRNKRSEIINGPWGQQLALVLEGDMSGQPSAIARDNLAWTPRYPTQALFPMMALVKKVRESDLSRFQAPVLVLYSAQDQTVDPEETRAAFDRIGSAIKTLELVDYSRSPGQHVLAGDLRDPAATAPMAQRLVQWAQALPPGP